MGSNVRFSIASVTAKAYLAARQIPRDAKFNAWGARNRADWHKATNAHRSGNIAKIFGDVVGELTDASPAHYGVVHLDLKKGEPA